MGKILDFDDGFTSETPSVVSTTIASEVTVTPSGNLAANDVQEALVELQTDIDTRATSASVTSDIASAVAALVASSPATLDTLDELANALGDDPNFATTMATSLGNRLRVDTAAQGLNGTQKTNAKTNIDLQNVDNTSDATKNAAAVALTNKTIDGSSNTITNVPLTTAVTGSLPIANGGTGQTTKAPAFDALSPMSASGDLIYGGTAGTGTRLPKGSDGTYLTLSSGLPAWSTLAGSALSVTSKSATYTITTSDDVILASGASFTLTLYTAVGNSGKIVRIIHTGTSLTQVYTLATTSSQTIGGVAGGSYALYTNNESITLISDGTNWQILEHKAKTPWTNAGPITITGTTSNPTKASSLTNDKIWWKRDGDTGFFRVEFGETNNTGAANGTGDYKFALIPNITFDSSKVTFYATVEGWSSGVGQAIAIGSGYFGAVNGAQGNCAVIPFDASNVRIFGTDTSPGGGCIGSGGYQLGLSGGVYYSFSFSAGITGWQP